MTSVFGWRVYCADGSTYTQDPHLIPPTVQAVVWFHAHPYRDIEVGEDFYEVEGVTLTGLEIPIADFEALYAVAFADRDWPA
jgi:hypothetical protein